MELIDTGVNKMTEFEDKLKKRIKEHDVAMTGLHNQGFVNGLKVALDLFETTDELSVEKLQEQLNTARYFFKNILDVNPNLNKGQVSHLENCVRVMKNSAEKALAAIGGDDD